MRSFGETWLRWRGQRVEYCRCALEGRELCHVVPVISECGVDMHAYTHTNTHTTHFLFTSPTHYHFFNQFPDQFALCVPPHNLHSLPACVHHSHVHNPCDSSVSKWTAPVFLCLRVGVFSLRRCCQTWPLEHFHPSSEFCEGWPPCLRINYNHIFQSVKMPFSFFLSFIFFLFFK